MRTILTESLRRAVRRVALACLLLPGLAFAQARVTGLSLDTASVTGGSGAQVGATVTLSAPAPAGGLTVGLASSLSDVAATSPTVLVPAGASSARFTIGTNALYRRYSGLGFAPVISATGGGGSATATLNISAQPVPTGSVTADRTEVNGNVCGAGGYLRRGDPGVLYSCRAGGGAQLASCTVVQECAVACQTTRATQTYSFSDFCTASGPQPATLSAKVVVGGNATTGTLAWGSAAGPLSEGLISSNQPATATPVPGSRFSFPQGSTSAGFSVSTLQVAAPVFARLGALADLGTQSGSSIFMTQRIGATWLAVVPAGGSSSAEISPAVLSLAVITDPINGGTATSATVTLNAAAPVGGATILLNSSNTAVASVPASVVVPAGQNSATFVINTSPVAANTSVTVGASGGGVTVSDTFTVTAPAVTLLNLGVSVSGKAGEGVTSSPAGIAIQAGGAQTASFKSGTAITLTANNGRDAIWSGACSSGGRKAKSCSFTLNASGNVSAAIQ